MKRFKLGDLVKTVDKSALNAREGVITNIMSGKNLGFPWEDDTDYYGFKDKRTGKFIIAHPRTLERIKE